MSNNESFINEVTEEVRRDQLFMYLRRYGWIAVASVLILVGGAAYNEYRKASEEATAQALGDAVFAALDNDDAQARVAALQETGDLEGAAARLDTIATDPEVAPIYRDLASLKSLMLQADTMEPDARRAALEALAVPGAPFRLLAMEQIAFTHVAAGDNAAAIETLRAVLEDAEVTRGLRDRAQSLIVALGGNLDGSADPGQ